MKPQALSIKKFRLLAYNNPEVRDTVRTWLNANMPCFPLQMLQPLRPERFEPMPFSATEAKRVKTFTRECPACGDVKHYSSLPDEPKLCCQLELLALQDECDFDEEMRIVLRTLPRHKANASNQFHHLFDDESMDGMESIDVILPDGKVVAMCVFDDEDAAAAAAHVVDLYPYVSVYGFPWANTQVYVPDPRIELADLAAAGFLSYTFYPGSDRDTGRYRSSGYRVCGIDGGGYDMFHEHLVRLFALHHCTTQTRVLIDKQHYIITP